MTSGSAGSNRSNSSISRVRTVVRSSPAVRFTSAINRSNAAGDVLLQDLDVGGGERRLDVVGRGIGQRDGIGRLGRRPLAGTRSAGPHPWPRRGRAWRRGSPGRPRARRRSRRASRWARACASSGSTSSASPSAPPASLPAVALEQRVDPPAQLLGRLRALEARQRLAGGERDHRRNGLHAEHLRDPRRGVDVDRRQRPLAAVGVGQGGETSPELRRWTRCAVTTAARRPAPRWSGPAPRLRSWPR